MTDSPEYPGTPRWVRIAAALALVLILILIALLLLGGPEGHGPARHLSVDGRTVGMGGSGGG
jgi:hypothetical protein